MAKPYYLIDFENVQPKALDRLAPGQARIQVFLGEHQTRLMLDMVQALQPFGADAEYIAITGNGPDAVDFHIAYYIGRISVLDPAPVVRIISRDKGFDPLVRHLASRGIDCQRLPEIPASAAAARPATAVASSGSGRQVTKAAAKAAKKTAAARKAPVKPAAPVPATASTKTPVAAKPAKQKTTVQWVQLVLSRLHKSSKPNTVAGLKACIRTWVAPAGDDAVVEAVLQSLRTTDKITVKGEKVTYAKAD